MVQIGFLISQGSIITNNTQEGGLKELVTTTIVRLSNVILPTEVSRYPWFDDHFLVYMTIP
jgi:hypothetical protein